MDPRDFQKQLAADPAIALRPPAPTQKPKAGPLHRLQFVIEFVGPRTTPAAAAAALLDPQWYAALGQPQLWTMSAADNAWQPMTNSTAGSYDSIAATWDLVSAKGALSPTTARHLFQTAEQIATHLNRRAIPLPHPNDVAAAVAELKAIEENFDAGFSLVVAPRSGSVSETDLWIWCAKLGLTFGSTGTFDWIISGIEQPLLSLSPLGGDETFSLGNAQSGTPRAGALMGFNVPTCPNPAAALEGLFSAAAYLANQMPGDAFDDSDQPLSEASKSNFRQALGQVQQAMEKAGIAPGSTEALRLFGKV